MNTVDQFRLDMDNYFTEYGWISEFFLEKYTEKLKLSNFHDALIAANEVLDNPELYDRDAREMVTQEVCDSVAHAIEKLVIMISANKGIELAKSRNWKKFIGYNLVIKSDLCLLLREEWGFEIGVGHFNFDYTLELPSKDIDRPNVLADVMEYIVQQAETSCSSFIENVKGEPSRNLENFTDGYIVEHKHGRNSKFGSE